MGVSALFLIGICIGWANTQFLNNRPFPTYSLENMPDTEFSCRDKILGGYYADADTQCQMFHICVKVAGVGIQDFRFLCPNGTAFDQDHQICAEWEDVDCDATTLYYSSDNFDLYRIGSGLESKRLKYGEEEETFALQRAETGDARLNRDHQSNSVNQKKEVRDNYYNRPNQQRQNNQNNERDIFKASSSSNFYNNRNNGKERDEDYDDNVNVNQDRDYEQKKKDTRVKQQRRPAQNRQQNNDHSINNDYRNSQDYNNERNDNYDAQTRRPSARPTGFTNNFAGSSYIPTTSKPSSTTINSEQYTTAVNNYRGRQGQRHRVQQEQYNDADNFRQTNNNNSPATSTNTPYRQTQQQYNNADNFKQTSSNNSPPFSTSTPVKQTQQYNTPPLRQPTTNYNNNNYQQQYTTTQNPSRETENFSQQRPKQTTPYDDQYDVPKVKPTKKENYPTTAPQSYNTQYDVPKTKQTENYPAKATTFGKTENYPSNNPQYAEKKPTTPLKQTENYPTTFSPKPKPFSVNSEPATNLPTTFAPRTNAAFTQIVQQTQNYNHKQPINIQQLNSQNPTTQHNNPTNTFSQQHHAQTKNSTPKSTAYTQYTPTVPKITSTTPVSRSNRFDETQYDDGSYNSKYDDDKREDEFLKTAHSQNIAASRNELARTTKQQQSTQKPQFDSPAPRPFSVSPNTPKVTNTPKATNIPKVTDASRPTVGVNTKTTQQTAATNKPSSITPSSTKTTKTKDVSYDYAYYDSNPSSETDYEIDTELKKSTVKQ
ncbi:hypothetical protein NQ315_013439 [Exocentrus adspersus]|uniref:Chitin-binding type-2 domain-containing protein n=1 Tax=Exocentrus adspersus TaxID=1586481 RepID=A0AAV8VHR6_9CUCU|nr:hypothetical protein NQ315_013439 [Exocentrus adspersus]